MKSVFVTGYALCHFSTSCVYSDSQDYSCLRRAGSGPLPACLGLAPACSRPPPHEVGVCHRLCPVSFSDFVCLSEAVRALPVSFRIRNRAPDCAKLAHACSCPSRPPPARLLYMKSVFVTGYDLCNFPTSCDFPRPRTRPRPVCLSEAEAEAAHPQAHPSTSAHAVRGPVSRPPLYPANGPNVTACRTRSPKLRCLPVPSGAVACSTGS